MTHAADDACAPSGEYQYLCGLHNAEDLVQVPDTRWIIASSLKPGDGLYLIDTEEKSWSGVYANGPVQALQNREIYNFCEQPPDVETFITHGLNLQPGEDGHSTLYVVGHGGREAIEVFDVDATGSVPVLSWMGCVFSPDGMQINSVASLKDGSLLATVPLLHGAGISTALQGLNTGSVFRWSPGDSGFTEIKGTGLPYPNGIEVSEDGLEFYVASSGLFNVSAYSNTNPARLLRRTEELTILPDNLHRDVNGLLITGGLNQDSLGCGQLDRSEEFSIEAFAACPRPFAILSIKPQSMIVQTLATGPANAHFSNITMALSVADELWIGTFSGDRIAYKTLHP